MKVARCWCAVWDSIGVMCEKLEIMSTESASVLEGFVIHLDETYGQADAGQCIAKVRMQAVDTFN